MSDAYAFATSSGLKLKKNPTGVEPSIKKKKKKKNKNKEREQAIQEYSKEVEESGEGSSKEETIDLFRDKTPFEVAYLKRKREKEMEKIRKKAELNHKEKVEKFNEGLNKLSEHYDIPKVSWTK